MQKLTPRSFFENYIYSLTDDGQSDFLKSFLKLLLVIKKVWRHNIYMYDDVFGGVVQLYNLLKSTWLQSSRSISQIISLVYKNIIWDKIFVDKASDGIVKYSHDKLYIRNLNADLDKIMNSN